MHSRRAYLPVKPDHLALEERLAVAVRRRVSAHDVEGVEDQLVSDCADDLVPRLAAVDHRPPPLAELRVRAARENSLPGLREEVLDEGKDSNDDLSSLLGNAINNRKKSELLIDFGSIQSDMSLRTNTFPDPIPQSDYSVLRQLTLGETGTFLTVTANDGMHMHGPSGPQNTVWSSSVFPMCLTLHSTMED